MGEVIAFVSGKGGTGKSALCAAIATILARDGHRVLCIDGDTGLRNLDIFLGIAQSEALSFLDICRGDYPLSAAYVHPQFPCLSFLTAPANPSVIPMPAFSQLLTRAQESFDYVLLDAPAGLGEGMAAMVAHAHRCIVTTLPDPASIRCAQRAGQELETLGCGNIRLVVNRVYRELLKALDMDIDDIMDTVGLPLLGVVPSDPDISLAAAKGKPLISYSRSGACAALRRIAKRIQGQPVPVANR